MRISHELNNMFKLVNELDKHPEAENIIIWLNARPGTINVSMFGKAAEAVIHVEEHRQLYVDFYDHLGQNDGGMKIEDDGDLVYHANQIVEYIKNPSDRV